MRLWLRTPSPRFSSYSIVWRNLGEAFSDLGHDVFMEFATPDKPETWIEVWWGDPRYWTWHGGKVAGRVAIALSETRSLIKQGREIIINNINHADLLLCPSYASMQAYQESPVGIPIKLMPFGVNPNAFPFVERDFFSRPFTFLHLGVTQFRKGSWLVPEAFIKAFGRKKDVRLTIANGNVNQPMYFELEQEYGVDKRIVFDNQRVANTLDWYSSAHVLVHPHLSEGFGLCIPEAMATGMPCLVSRCSSPREFFSDEFGWWIEMSELYSPISQTLPDTGGTWRLPDVNSLSEVMREAYENPVECANRGIAASINAQKELTWETGITHIIPELEKLC